MVYISDKAMDIYAKLVAIRFAKWLNEQGWREYDEADMWIRPTNNYKIYTTAQVYEKFEKEKTPVTSRG